MELPSQAVQCVKLEQIEQVGGQFSHNFVVEFPYSLVGQFFVQV